MLRPKPLFIMGNKRSGSTLMPDLLNSHANVFVSHEVGHRLDSAEGATNYGTLQLLMKCANSTAKKHEYEF